LGEIAAVASAGEVRTGVQVQYRAGEGGLEGEKDLASEAGGDADLAGGQVESHSSSKSLHKR